MDRGTSAASDAVATRREVGRHSSGSVYRVAVGAARKRKGLKKHGGKGRAGVTGPDVSSQLVRGSVDVAAWNWAGKGIARDHSGGRRGGLAMVLWSEVTAGHVQRQASLGDEGLVTVRTGGEAVPGKDLVVDGSSRTAIRDLLVPVADMNGKFAERAIHHSVTTMPQAVQARRHGRHSNV